MSAIDPARLALIGRRARDVLEQRRKSAERYEWSKIARPSQLPPAGNWRIWLVRAGRGYGKTRTGAEWVRAQVESGRCRRMALVGPTAADVRDVMVEGESGILAISPPDCRPLYEPSKRRLTWPNGAMATTYSADEPERLRGPQHDGAWADEVGAWKYPDEAWAMLMFGLRIGADPRCIATTTPRPIKLIRELTADPGTVMTTGSTYENRSNLSPAFFEKIISRYEGTRLGRQELDGELLEDVPDALWQRRWFDECRVVATPEMARIVVAIDPAVTATDDADETGIVVAGRGMDGHGYVLEDVSCRTSPSNWARVAIDAFRRWEADGIIGEVNNGGDLVEATLRSVDQNIPFRAVRASRGKSVRAEPISALYEQKKIHHVGNYGRLEDQMCAMTSTSGYTGAGSPDHADAAIWALTELMSNASAIQFFSEFRGARRAGEPAEANHIIAPVALKPWWQHWVSVSWGAALAMHWYCRHEDGRVHVYREIFKEGISAEQAGVLLAENSLEELGSNSSAVSLTAWMSPKYFDGGLGRKSIAQQFSEGIDLVCGKGSSFLFAYDDNERTLAPDLAWQSMLRRREKAGRSGVGITLQAAKGDAEAGWEHVRSLLRWWPLQKPPEVEYDREVARALLTGPDGNREKLNEYLRYVEGESDEALPGLLIHENCPNLIRALPALSRGDKGLPAEGEALRVAESLLYGAMADREQKPKEPVESFVERRLESMGRKKVLSGAEEFQVAQKAEEDWRKRQVKSFAFARLRRTGR